ncbi:Sec1-like protein [Hyaloraphidium curvatum]|nr:Sec1-like protein [Hyaloraphidium curvatum]
MAAPAPAGGPAPHTLPALLKKRLITDMVRSVDPPGKWKLMVVDAKSLKIMNGVLRVWDVLEENVTLVENLTRNRQPYPNLEAIYFLSPDEDSVNRFTKDFEGKALYAAAHLFFSSALSDRLFNKLKSTSASRYIKTCKELFVDFITFESHCFTLDSPETFHRIFSPLSPPANQNFELQSIAKRIVSVMATLGEYPNVRWWDGTQARVGGESLTGRLANLVQQEMDDLCRLDPDFPPASPYHRATLIIADRSIDPVAPLLHEFTYQAMINDLLQIQDGNKYTYTTAEGAVQSVTLDESDPLWVRIRHSHIAETINITIEKFNAFVGGNAAAKSALGAGGAKAGAAASLKDMKATLAALPQFQELKTKFAAHINLCQESMGLFERRKLASVGGIEQDMATGATAEGEVPKNVVVDMVPLLDDQFVSNLDKLRLLILYLIARDGISDDERRKLIASARLTPEDVESLSNLTFLGCRLSLGPRSSTVPKPRRYYEGSTVRNARTKKKGAEEEERPYDLSRYVPTLKYVMEDEARGCLDPELFPYTKELPPDAPSGSAAAAAAAKPGVPPNRIASLDPDRGKIVSLRTTKPTWATKTPQTLAAQLAREAETNPLKRAADEMGAEEDLRRNGGRVVVFVLGGLTYSELRSAYEVMKKDRRDVVLGTDALITPAEFVKNLRDLRNPAGTQTDITQDARLLESAISSITAGGAPPSSVPSSPPASPPPAVAVSPVFAQAPAAPQQARAAPPKPEPNRQGTLDEVAGKKKGLFGKLKLGKG